MIDSISKTVVETFSSLETVPRLLIASSLLVFLSLLVFREIAKPPDRRKSPPGKPWKLPPGPSGFPIIGNLLLMQKHLNDPEYKMVQSLAQYGEMTTMHLGAKTWVFLNSNRVTNEIIAKRGNITHDRSEFPVAEGLISRNMRSLILPSARWKEYRRVMHHLLSGSAMKQYVIWQEIESTQMLAEHLIKPEWWFRNHYRYSNSVINRIVLGERFVMSNQNLANMQRLVAEFTRGIGASLVDWFPMVAKIPRPLQLWRLYWEPIGKFHYEVYSTWWNPIKEKIENGTAGPSWARDVLLSDEAKFQGTAEEAKYLGMSVVEAGSDTSREVLSIFFMSVFCFPDVFQKLRDEADSVCGPNAARLPTVDDIPNLPFAAAYLKELLRWRPIFVLTPDHMLTKDLEFEGYHFPAGTSFVINGIPVANDCEKPQEFLPERWLADGKQFDVTSGLWGFGGGRRICVGYKLAQQGLILNLARLAYCFDFKAMGPYNPYHLNHDTTDEPFPARPIPRGPAYEKLILHEAEKAGVLEDANIKYEKIPPWKAPY